MDGDFEFDAPPPARKQGKRNSVALLVGFAVLVITVVVYVIRTRSPASEGQVSEAGNRVKDAMLKHEGAADAAKEAIDSGRSQDEIDAELEAEARARQEALDRAKEAAEQERARQEEELKRAIAEQEKLDKDVQGREAADSFIAAKRSEAESHAITAHEQNQIAYTNALSAQTGLAKVLLALPNSFDETKALGAASRTAANLAQNAASAARRVVGAVEAEAGTAASNEAYALRLLERVVDVAAVAENAELSSRNAAAAANWAESLVAQAQTAWDALPAVNCTLGFPDWSAVPCNAPCGGSGTKTRTQQVLSAANAKGICFAPLTETMSCVGPPCAQDCEVAEPDFTNVPCISLQTDAVATCGQPGIKKASPTVVKSPSGGGRLCTEDQLRERETGCVGVCGGDWQDVRVRGKVTARSKINALTLLRVRNVLQILNSVPKAPREHPVADNEPATKGYADFALSGFPVGTVMPYAGTATVPAGWRICDGTNGTPNLVGRFLMGTSTAVGSSLGRSRFFIGSELKQHTHGPTSEHITAFTTSASSDHTHHLTSLRQTSLIQRWGGNLVAGAGEDMVPIYWTQPQYVRSNAAISQPNASTLPEYGARTAQQSPDTSQLAGNNLGTLQNPAPADHATDIVNHPHRHLTATEAARQVASIGNHTHEADMSHRHDTGDAGEGKAMEFEPPHYALVFIIRVS
jgi:chemotaxis protein histidine kinase CheA